MKTKKLAILASVIMAAAAPMAFNAEAAYAAKTVKAVSTTEEEPVTGELSVEIDSDAFFIYDGTNTPVTPHDYKGKNYLTVKYNGEPLSPENYTLSYYSNILPGQAAAVVNGLGKYSALLAAQTFAIAPKVNEMKVTTSDSKIYVSWKKDWMATAYQVIYSKYADFREYNSTTITDIEDTDVTLSSKPRIGETWYVKMRSYVTESGETHNVPRYGKYTPAQRVTVKGTIGSITINDKAIYTGSAVKPSITVKDSRGYAVPENLYTATYTNNTKVGIATVSVKSKANQSIVTGSAARTFAVRPKTQEITKYIATPEKSGSYQGYIDVFWNKDSQATAYQVKISKNPNFPSSDSSMHSFIVKNTDQTSIRLAKYCKPGETWYVKVRSFWTKNGSADSGISRYGLFGKTLKIKIDPKTKETYTYNKATGKYSVQRSGFVTIKTSFSISDKIKDTLKVVLLDSNNKTVDSWNITQSDNTHTTELVNKGEKYRIKLKDQPAYVKFKNSPVEISVSGDVITEYSLDYVLPSKVFLPTNWISQYGSGHSSYTLCTPTSVVMAVNGDKNAGWSLYNVAAYAAASGLQSQVLRGDWSQNYKRSNGSWSISRGMIAPDAVKLVSQYSNGKYTAANLYPTNTTYNTDQICTILKEQLADGHRVVIMRLLSGGATHASTLYGYYYSGNKLYFNMCDPASGKYVISGSSVAYQINGVINIEPRAIIIIN